MDVVSNVDDRSDESILAQAEGTRLFLAGREVEGPGNFVVSDGDLYWWCAEKQTGYALPYERLIMHAVSRDTERFPHPCIYMQVEPSDDSSEGAAEDGLPVEVRIVPPSPEQLQELYEALCEGQELNPCEDDSDEEAEATGNPATNLGGGWVFSSNFAQEDGQDGEGLTEEGQATMARLMASLQADAQEEGEAQQQDQGETSMDQAEEEDEEGMFDDAD